MTSELLTKEMIILLILSMTYNLLVQIIYYFSNMGKFDTNAGMFSTLSPNFRYFIVLFDAATITLLFWCGQKFIHLSLNDLLIYIGVFYLCETLYREIKIKSLSLKRIVIDCCFNSISLFGTYFIFSKF